MYNTILFNLSSLFCFTTFWILTIEPSKRRIINWLPKQSWWKNAKIPQIKMMENFGFKNIDDEFTREAFSSVLVASSHHIFSALFMLPASIYGWQAISLQSRYSFVLGTASIIGFDIYDAIITTLRTFYPSFTLRNFGLRELPLRYWFIIVILHHTFSITTGIPMNIKYSYLDSYSDICVSLLFAAGLCYIIGCYKYSLDVYYSRKNFILNQLLVLCQFLIIFYSRIYIWFPNSYKIINTFYEKKDWLYLFCGTYGILLLSFFNFVMLFDASTSVIKWLPKKFKKLA